MCNRLLCLKKVEAKTKQWQHVATKASGCGWCVPGRGTEEQPLFEQGRAWRLVRRGGQKEKALPQQGWPCRLVDAKGRDNKAGLFRLENLQLFRSIWLLFHIEMTSWPRGEFIEVLSRFFGKHWKKPAVLVRCHRPLRKSVLWKSCAMLGRGWDDEFQLTLAEVSLKILGLLKMIVGFPMKSTWIYRIVVYLSTSKKLQANSLLVGIRTGYNFPWTMLRSTRTQTCVW